MRQVRAWISVVFAVGGLAGCAVGPPAPMETTTGKKAQPAEPQTSGGSAYHTTPFTEDEGTSVVPYGGNYLAQDPYTSESDYY